LSVDRDDKEKIECVIPLATDVQLQDFNYLFVNIAKKELSDSHLWLSIYARPPESPFTRCQRLSVAMSLLLTVMLASILFYKTEKISNNEENRIIGFSFTWSQVCRVIAVYDVASYGVEYGTW